MSISTELAPVEPLTVVDAISVARDGLLFEHAPEDYKNITREEYLSRIGNICIDAQVGVDSLPKPLQYAWNYTRGLQPGQTLFANGLDHAFKAALAEFGQE